MASVVNSFGGRLLLPNNGTITKVLAPSKTRTSRCTLLARVWCEWYRTSVPLSNATTDQRVEGGPQRARNHLSDEEANKYLDGSWRVRIINCWKLLSHPADGRPMAMCNYTTIDHNDLIAADRVSREYTGEIFYLQHNPAQQWYWISGQTPEELLFFINYDSHPRGGPPCRRGYLCIE